jgi:hypothetical protein
VSLSPTLTNGGPRNYGSGFLPSVYQGTAIGRPVEGGRRGHRNIAIRTAARQQQHFELAHERGAPRKPAPRARAVAFSFELAWRLQNPPMRSISKETAATGALRHGRN